MYVPGGMSSGWLLLSISSACSARWALVRLKMLLFEAMLAVF